jgi:hypothetical protein
LSESDLERKSGSSTTVCVFTLINDQFMKLQDEISATWTIQ